MEIKKNFARNIDSKTKKATIIGIMATYSGNVVPNAVTRSRGHAVTLEKSKNEGLGRIIYSNIILYYILYYNIIYNIELNALD